MKIKYRHIADSEQTKIFDTVIAFKKTPAFLRFPTQEEYDQAQLRLMEKDFDNGIVLEYEILPENT